MDESKAEQVYDVPSIRASLLAKMGEYAGDYPEHIEQRYPHILARLAELWGTPALDKYLDTLLLPDRQERQGFPGNVATEVFHLSSVHSQLTFDQKATTSGWGDVVDTDLDKRGFNAQ